MDDQGHNIAEYSSRCLKIRKTVYLFYVSISYVNTIATAVKSSYKTNKQNMTLSSLEPGSAEGEKGKKRGQIGKISVSEARRMVSNADFCSFFPQCGAWSQARH